MALLTNPVCYKATSIFSSEFDQSSTYIFLYHVPGIKLRARDSEEGTVPAFKLLIAWELGLVESQRCEQIMQ